MSKLFLQYPKCTTCKKAKKFLVENNVEFKDRDITLDKEMNLKDKLKDMSDKEKIELLATNGKLVKRPLLICDDKVLVGFKEEKYREIL